MSTVEPELTSASEIVTLQSQRIEPTLSSLPTELKALIVEQVATLDQQRFNVYNDAPGDWVDDYAARNLAARGWKIESGDAQTQLVLEGEGDTDAGWTTQSEDEDAEPQARSVARGNDRVGIIFGDADSQASDSDKANPDQPAFVSILSKLSLVSREWSELCRSALWRQLDLTETPTLKLMELVKDPLGRYGRLVESLILDQEFDVDDLDDCLAEHDTSLDVFITTVESLAKEHDIRLDPADEQERHDRVRSLIFAVVLRLVPNLKALDMVVRERPYADQSAWPLAPRDYAFEAATEFGEQLEELQVYADSSEQTAWAHDSFYIGDFAGLRSLTLNVAAPKLLGKALLRDITSLPLLQQLDLSEADYFDDYVVDIPWSSSLQSLGLSGAEDLSYSAFCTLLEMHPTLVKLDLQDVPINMTDRELESIRPLSLPNLRLLELSTVLPARFLDHFLDSPIQELCLGFAPSISVRVIESFISTHQRTLKRLTLNEIDQFSDGQIEGLELLCHAGGIEFMAVYPSSDDDDEVDEYGDWAYEESEVSSTSDPESLSSFERRSIGVAD
ncbi:hypothetical protein ACM66B_000489 [Microbotryomycetes sp. NB124-2]